MKKKINWIVFGIILIALFIRLMYLAWPDWQVFDEIYFYNFSKDYLTNHYFFDIHPPLGKLITAIGIYLFNYQLVGARIMQAFFGTGVLYLIYLLTKELFKNNKIAMIALIIAFFETSLFIESRLALLNIYLLFFSLLSYYYFWKFANNLKNTNLLYLALIFCSMSAAIKWTGLAPILVFTIYLLFTYKNLPALVKKIKKQGVFKTVSFSILALTVPYLLSFTLNIIWGDSVIGWHQQAFNYNTSLVSNHPYASDWFQWIFALRPLWLEFKTTNENMIIGMIEIGNPIIIYTGMISLLFNSIYCFYKKNTALLFIIIGFWANLIPWMIIQRESYYYHFLPSLLFLIISCAYFLYIIIKKYHYSLISYLIIISMAVFFVWYWPLLNGLKISQHDYQSRVFLNIWK